LFFYVLNLNNSNTRAISRLVNALARHKFRDEYRDCENGEIAVVIPAYNEAENIGPVLQRIPKEVLGKKVQTYVVVDGGKDGTDKVVRDLGFPVLVHPINRGGGAALRAGYEIALESGAEIIVTLDADGQHVPAEIPNLIKPILDDEADFVNGSRVLGSFEKESEIRALGVVFFNWLISILMGTRVTDASNAFRAIRADTLRRLTLYQDQFHTSELLIEALKKGARVKEVPITILKRQSGVTKKPPSLRYSWGFTKAILSTWLR
jgi:glycosyltransferase involved in cell wall biosynthesis